MRNILIPVLRLLLLFQAIPVMAQIDYKGFPEWSLKKKDSTEYALYTPAHLQPGRKYPVVLFMHGCCGVDNHASLRNAVDPPVRMWHQFGANKQTIPTYIIAPATSRGWKQHFAALKVVIDDLIEHQQGDPQRIYVTGFSMGGEGTFKIIQEYPGFFAAALPMGMDFSGDSLKVKDFPIWANQGETDYYSRNLRRQVAAIRKLNAPVEDTGSTLLTGVYPRYSNFTGMGHGVQWAAASTQDLTGWAYSKIKDGNKEPVVFISPSSNPIKTVKGAQLALTVHATDPDGHIEKVVIRQNHIILTTLRQPPYQFVIRATPGDRLLEAIAYDNKGKHSEATTIVRVPIAPVFTKTALPAAYAGSVYDAKVMASGNGLMQYTVTGKNPLPKGLQVFPNGHIRWVPLEKGVYKLSLKAADAEGQAVEAMFNIVVKDKKAGEVLVTTAGTDSVSFPLGKMAIGEAPFFNSKDSALHTSPEEINFSSIGKYAGLTFIRTDENDARKSGDSWLHFTIDENAMLYIAYEKMDNMLSSTIPAWLQSWKKEPGQVIAQYRYFDVYSKAVKKGRIVLPAADAGSNGVSSNYFVMIKKQ